MVFNLRDDENEQVPFGDDNAKSIADKWEQADSEERDRLIDEISAKSGQDVRDTFDKLNAMMDIWDEMSVLPAGDTRMVELHKKFTRIIASCSPTQLYSIIGSGVVALANQRKDDDN